MLDYRFFIVPHKHAVPTLFTLMLLFFVIYIDGPPKDDVLVPPVEAFGVISAFAVLATALSLLFVCFSIWHRKEK